MQVASLSISTSVQRAFDQFFGYLPNLLGFVVILLVGYFVARIVRSVVNKLLAKSRIDATLRKGRAGQYVEKASPGGRPSRLIGALVFWLIFLYVLSAAISALQIPAVTSFMNQVLAYLPNVIAAVIIFVIAAAISGAIAAVANKTMGETPTGKLAETVGPGVVMAIAIFMILTQLQIAPAIVTITYAALLGMLALTGALAFGLGGRDVAARMWSTAYDKSQDAKDQAQSDLLTAKQRAQEQMPSSDEAPRPSGAVRTGIPPAPPGPAS